MRAGNAKWTARKPGALLTGGATALAVFALLGCAQGGLDAADRAELDNMWRGNMVPRSSAGQMVAAFDQFCRRAPDADLATSDLRASGYVPLPRRAPGAQAFVSDDGRPAVAVSDRMCVVRARARSGQSNRFASYVSDAFPGARATEAAVYGRDIERAWTVPGPAVVASARERDVDFFIFTLIYYRPEVA